MKTGIQHLSRTCRLGSIIHLASILLKAEVHEQGTPKLHQTPKRGMSDPESFTPASRLIRDSTRSPNNEPRKIKIPCNREACLQGKDRHESADGRADAGHVARRRRASPAGGPADEPEVLTSSREDSRGHGGREHPPAGHHDAARAHPDGDAHEHTLLKLPRLLPLPLRLLPAPAAAAAAVGGDRGGREERGAAEEALERGWCRDEEAEAEGEAGTWLGGEEREAVAVVAVVVVEVGGGRRRRRGHRGGHGRLGLQCWCCVVEGGGEFDVNRGFCWTCLLGTKKK
uniref:Uncharacterized protein n=1 Tax=Oryza meridionalis TaxID=40149 RepID=A0A0E0CEU8_9ORYZ